MTTTDPVFRDARPLSQRLSEQAAGWWAALWRRTEPVARHAVPVAAAGLVLLVVSLTFPWTTFDFGYPGNMAVGALTGHRWYLLVLGLVTTGLVVTRIPGRQRAARLAALGGFAIALVALLTLVNDGGGLGAITAAPWLALVGTLVLLVVAFRVEVLEPVKPPRLSAGADIALLLVAAGVGLAILYEAFAIEDAKQFVLYLVFVAALAGVAAALSALRALTVAFDRFPAIGSIALLLAVAAFPLTQNGNATWIRVLDTVLVLSAASVGLNVVVGLAGLLDLGYIAFYGFGGYVAAFFSNALFTTVHVHLPFALVLLMGAVVAAIFGIIIGAPTLRLRGDYLAIVTLGFGEIFHVVANGWDQVTRGPNGISSIPDLKVGSFSFETTHNLFGVPLPRVANYYYLALVLLVAVILIFRNLNDSRIGRAWIAIREDEVAARASGINTTALKLMAFAIGAFLAGLGGAVNAHLATQTDPSSYVFDYSATLLAAVVLGGMGTVPGAIIGITLLVVLPERLRFIENYRLLIFGASLVLMMRFRPEGIWANRRRQREFHDPTSGADAMSQPGQVAPV